MTINNTLELELISDPEIIRYTHMRNAEVWSAKLTKEQYADREWLIGCESRIGRRKGTLGVFHYVLRDLSLDSKTKTDNIVASLETLNRKAWRIKGSNGKLEDVVCACVGGVFTFEEHRGKGYATEMITRLNEKLENQLGKNAFTFLYSEVGDYYSRFGYYNFEVPLHYIPIEAISLPKVNKNDYHPLKYEDYQPLVDAQYDKVKLGLITKSKTLKHDETLVSLVPNLDIYTWFHDRDIFISKTLKPENEIENFGAVLNGTKDHILWLHDWNSEILTIVRLYNEHQQDVENFKQLLNIAIEEAHKYGFKGINIWHTTLGEDKSHIEKALEYIEESLGAKTYQENSSISAIRLHDGTSKEKVFWENNDKWCWF